MAITVKVEPINRDVKAFIDEMLSPAARSAALAEFAEDQIEEARATNEQALGRDPKYEVTVDGKKAAPLISVRPDGVIFVEFEYIADVVLWIWQQLYQHSPHKTGRYQRSHSIFIDGQEIRVGSELPPRIDEIVFMNTQPYARKLELGSSTQAPDGVYQSVALLARQRFRSLVKVEFTYRGLIAGSVAAGHLGNRTEVRQPAIVVRID